MSSSNLLLQIPGQRYGHQKHKEGFHQCFDNGAGNYRRTDIHPAHFVKSETDRRKSQSLKKSIIHKLANNRREYGSEREFSVVVFPLSHSFFTEAMDDFHINQIADKKSD